MRIGELAERSGVSVKALRYYESIGVLEAPPRTRSGYRDYPSDVVDRLAFVKAAQGVGLTLGEIRGVLSLRDRGETPCAHVLDLVDTRRREIDRRIEDLERMRDELDRLARRGRNLNPEQCPPDAVCHVISPR